MPDGEADLEKADKLAAGVRAARASFAQLFDAEAIRQRPDALRLHVLVQQARIGAPNVAQSGSDEFAIRVAFRHAAQAGWLQQLAMQVALAGMFQSSDAAVAAALQPEGMTIEPHLVVDGEEGFADPQVIGTGLQVATQRVCEIIVDHDNLAGPAGHGSGFLVGPQTVLTNWHVIRRLFKADGSKVENGEKRIRVRFDRMAQNRRAVSFDVARIEAWDPAYRAEYDGGEICAGAEPWTGAEECLDFALLRLRGAPGFIRGWYDLRADHWPRSGGAMYVLQFPGQYAMRVTIGRFRDWCDEVNHRRVRHEANSASGASGGLCLGYDMDAGQLRACAMHQAGVKGLGAPGEESRAINHAIPLAKIAPKVKGIARRLDGVAPIYRLDDASGPVLGRDTLQQHIGEAVVGDARILVVWPEAGLTGSARRIGKSFSIKILRSMLSVTRNVLVTLSARDIPTDARQLADAILARVEPASATRAALPEMHDPGTTKSAWIADTLLKGCFAPRLEAAAGEKLIWLVIDDLDAVDLPDAGGRAFLDALYQNIASIPCLRIMLVGLRRELESFTSKGLVRIDRISRPPGRSETAGWLKHRFGPGRSVDPDLIDGLAGIACSLAGNGDDSACALAAAVQAHFDPCLPRPVDMQSDESDVEPSP